MRHTFIFLFFLLPVTNFSYAQQQSISLEDCFRIAAQNNLSIRQKRQAIATRQFQYQASKLSVLPKVDLLGGYTYLSDPIKINLQSVREGIVEGTAKQNVDAANRVFHEMTGNDLSPDAQNAIGQSARNIINAVYPDYNPSLSEQQYFTAGLALHMPIYMGGKLRAAREVAGKQLESGKLNLRFVQDNINFAIAAQYIEVLYLNSMIAKQRQLLDAFEKTKENAASLVENEIIPPYQAHWANVALSQASSGLNTFLLEKENALLTLQHLLGTDSAFLLSDTLKEAASPISVSIGNYWENNTNYQWLQAKTSEAKSLVKTSRSLSLPNVFGVANYQFLKNDLPVITPPWMVGVMFQWNIFSSFENGKHIRATKSLVKESELLEQETKADLQLQIKIAQNKLKAFGEEMKTLDLARKEAATTTDMIRRRMANQLASVKDVNDALKIQLEAEKAYYTSVLAYNLAVAAYLNITGQPEAITGYLK